MIQTNPVLPLRTQMYLQGAMVWFVLPLLFYVPATISVLFVVLFMARLILLLLGIQTLSRWLLLVLILIVTVLVYRYLGTILGREGGVSLLILLIALKSFESQKLSDWYLLLQVQLLAMGAVLLFNQHIWVVGWVLFDLWLFVSLLGWLGSGRPFHVCRQAAKIMLMSLPCTLLIFLIVPRVDVGGADSRIGITGGMGETLEAGTISHLVETNQLEFKASFDPKVQIQPKDLYWRGVVMGQNRQGVWHSIHEAPNEDHIMLEPESAEYPVRRYAPIHYQLILNNKQLKVPLLDYPVVTDKNQLYWQTGHVAQLKQPLEEGEALNMQAVLSDQLAQNLSFAEQQFYTDLPAGMNPQTRRLAQLLADRSRNDEDFIRHVLAFFHQQQFVYSLSPRRGTDRNKRTDFFLFNSREGFCEDYADAMVWLARSVGIPARIIGGYLGGDRQPNGEWQILGKNAHAWTEIWLQDKKIWLRVDPTAAASSIQTQQGRQSLPQDNVTAVQSAATADLQQSQLRWQRWVMDYRHDYSASLLPLFKKYWLWGVVVLLLLILMGLGIRKRKADQVLPLSQGWQLLGDLLALEPEDFATLGPEEVKAQLIKADLMTVTLAALVEQYIMWVYASAQLPQLRQQCQWLRKLRQELRHIQKRQPN